MDLSFLVLIAAPLSVYLIFMLMSLGDIETPPPPEHVETATPAEIIHTTVQTDAPHASDNAFAIIHATTPKVTQAASSDIATTENISPLALATAATVSSESVAPLERALPHDAPAPVSESQTIDTATPTADVLRTDDMSAEIIPAATVAGSSESIASETEQTDSVVPPFSETPVQDNAETLPAETVMLAAPEKSTAIITPTDADESSDSTPDASADEIELEGPLVLPGKGSPKFVFDYRGRLWVEKKRRGFFRQLRRPQIPPDEPQ